MLKDDSAGMPTNSRRNALARMVIPTKTDCVPNPPFQIQAFRLAKAG